MFIDTSFNPQTRAPAGRNVSGEEATSSGSAPWSGKNLCSLRSINITSLRSDGTTESAGQYHLAEADTVIDANL